MKIIPCQERVLQKDKKGTRVSQSGLASGLTSRGQQESQRASQRRVGSLLLRGPKRSFQAKTKRNTRFASDLPANQNETHAIMNF